MQDTTETQCAIGVDVGGTKIAAGLVSLAEGRLLARELLPTRPERGGEAVLSEVIALVRSMQKAAERFEVRPASIGMGICELVSPNGQVLSEATVRWKGLSVGAALHDATQLPVTLDADVRAAARGEAYLGAGREFGSFLYVTVGTGISASLVVDKIPYAGSRGLTGTFASSGVLIPSKDGQLVGGQSLEQFAAGPAIASRFAEACDGFKGAAPEVFALAEAGDERARSIISTAGAALGAGIAHLINMLDPEAVVIGGGVGVAGGVYYESVERAMREYVWSELHGNVALLMAKLGNDAGIIGAALGANMAATCEQ